MKINSLTQFAAKNLPPGKHADGQGLWLVKRDRARGKWVLRIVVGRKRREMGLGRWPDVSIGEARERAAEARKGVRFSIDPVEARKASRRVVRRLTVKEAVDSCFEARKAQLKGEGEAGRWMSPLNSLILPKIGTEALEAVDQLRLKEVLEPVWHTKPVAARKALNRMNLAFLHAAALGLSVDLQACMKARALLGKQRHEEKHIPSLPYAEAPKFYRWLVGLEGQSARALRFLMLTMARSGEVRFAKRSQITAAVWTIPAAHTKTGVERRVPLVASAQSLVQDGLLFPSPRGKPLSDMAMLKIMKKAGYDARPHGFRATFRTWCEECSDANYETKEACLGHAVDTGVQAAYQRSDRLEKRRGLLSQWEHFLTA